MNMLKFFHATFTTVREKSGSKAKLEAFREALHVAGSSGFLSTFEYWVALMFSGKITFGITKFTEPREFLDEDISEDFEEVLHQLAERDITGNAAKTAIFDLLSRGPACGPEVMSWFLNKDPKAGFQATSANKVLSKPIYIWTNQKPQSLLNKGQKGEEYNDWKLIPPGTKCLAEIKFDGNRTYIVKAPGKPSEALSAFGHSVPAVENFLLALDAACASIGKDGFVLDGEFYRTDRGHTGSILRSHTPCGIDDIDFFAFAKLDYSDWEQSFKGPTTKTNKDVRASVKEFVKEVNMPQLKLVKGYNLSELSDNWPELQKELNEIMLDAVEAGYEGIVIKDLSAVYDRGRSDDNRAGWWKAKFLDWYDARIVDIEEGSGKWKNMLGAFVVDYKGVINRVSLSLDGSLTNEKRIEYWESKHTLIDKVIRVQAYGITKDGSFNHAKFAGFHEGKI
jgi:hypothetical protein